MQAKEIILLVLNLLLLQGKGQLLQVFMWPPYEMNLSDVVPQMEETLLELEIVGSPRNMLEPFLLKKADLCLSKKY